jgi:DNA helicase-2/ATP-dependent DNA helicase PcrA
MRNAETLSLSAVIDHIISTIKYGEYLEIEYGEIEGAERAENLRELMSDASDYEGLVAMESIAPFLEYVTLVTSSDTSAQQDALTMMTIHTSKGLEFHSVAIVGAEEGIFPNARTLMDPMGELLEERRLMYVAMTRAKHNLMITRSRTRTTYGSYQENMPSRFLKEIPSEFAQFSSESSDIFSGSQYMARSENYLPKSPLARPAPTPLRDTSGYSLGQRVEHPKF